MPLRAAQGRGTLHGGPSLVRTAPMDVCVAGVHRLPVGAAAA
eukprot:CAMPEP_0168467570 /NCGR_PEP_ID=MMETSP0228-20121227/57250_1 /TAXON_ID=133427 /ORGANISM="Protoceratium reticulatum, Strain CCCM 535 (=CCMP 1889)" /LENGTH=41 /DNA_ID= /DNA_START= /DNA_END= /DNA_ORIENTATION=